MPRKRKAKWEESGSRDGLLSQHSSSGRDSYYVALWLEPECGERGRCDPRQENGPAKERGVKTFRWALGIFRRSKKPEELEGETWARRGLRMGSDPTVWVRGKPRGDLSKGNKIWSDFEPSVQFLCGKESKGQAWEREAVGVVQWEVVAAGTEAVALEVEGARVVRFQVHFKSRADGIFWWNGCRIGEKVEPEMTHRFSGMGRASGLRKFQLPEVFIVAELPGLFP